MRRWAAVRGGSGACITKTRVRRLSNSESRGDGPCAASRLAYAAPQQTITGTTGRATTEGRTKRLWVRRRHLAALLALLCVAATTSSALADSVGPASFPKDTYFL